MARRNRYSAVGSDPVARRLQSAVRARTQAWHAHSPHSPHSLRRASMRGHRGLDEQITGGSIGTPKTPKQKIIPLRDPETIVVAPEDNV